MPTATELKLNDAATQMRLAIEHSDSEEVFRSCINSYLSASRSVTMIMEKESKNSHPELFEWYKTQSTKLGEVPLFQFFNSQRVFSIHRGVVEPTRKQWKVENVRLVSNPTSGEGRALTGSWDVLSDVSPGGVGDVVTLLPDGTMTAWVFDGFESVWPHHSGNVLSVCEMHFLVLKGIVHGWLRERARLS